MYFQISSPALVLFVVCLASLSHLFSGRSHLFTVELALIFLAQNQRQTFFFTQQENLEKNMLVTYMRFSCFQIAKYFCLQCCLNCFHLFPVEKRASGFTLLERDIHVQLSCFSARFSCFKIAKYFVFSAVLIVFICSLWKSVLLASHFQNEIYRDIHVQLSCFSARFSCLKIAEYSCLQRCLNCFYLFPVEKRASGFTLLERDIHVQLSCFSARFSCFKIAKYFCLQCCLNCFHLLPVEKRASGFTLLERDIHVQPSCFSARFSRLKIAEYSCLQCCLVFICSVWKSVLLASRFQNEIYMYSCLVFQRAFHA